MSNSLTLVPDSRLHRLTPPHMSEQKNTNFPVLPSKDTIQAGVFDKSTSDSGNTAARVEHFQAAPGPVVPQDMSVFEQKLSKEEILARTAELNKKSE